ncbi:MAG: ATP-dependent DNA helicase RecG [Clostridia bacterium]|nr:ATP-dependent DNA helicase RecG [Clostridia bacterium]
MRYIDKPVRELRGVGEKKTQSLARLGIATVHDLIRFYPRAFQDRRVRRDTALLPDGEKAAVVVCVTAAPTLFRKSRTASVTRIRAADDSGSLTLVFFNQEYRAREYRRGDWLCVFGTVRRSAYGVEIIVEDVSRTNPEAPPEGGWYPIYRSGEGISSREISRLIDGVLPLALMEFEETLPPSVVQNHALMTVREALRAIHRPKDEAELELARTTLVFEELFVLTAGLSLLKRRGVRNRGLSLRSVDMSPFFANLPYKPTSAQRRSVEEALRDMTSGAAPMNRLLQGDVGSGKTTVAAACAYAAAKSGFQTAVLAPTEILAVQHAESFSRLLAPFGIRCGLILGSTTAAEKRRVIEGAESGEIDVLIGTHALLEDRVRFARLGLSVCDEQHRFGVLQRGLLSGKGADSLAPHTLVMSATPIPRTLALVMYGDMDISVIDELPPGRKPVKTYAVGEDMRPRIENFIRKQVADGHQVYVVCPLIEESEMAEGLIPVTDHFEDLSTRAFPDLSVGLMHGRLKAAEKAAVMENFRRGEIDVLVTTTVIEVGVDVPNATLMVIENAERFGLSQLHQLRGRVGRGADEAFCVLMSRGGESAAARLKVMCATNDGFKVAEADLAQRGPGDFFGSRQHGLPVLTIASLSGDMRTLHAAADAAETYISADPALSAPDSKPLRDAVYKVFETSGAADLFVTL